MFYSQCPHSHWINIKWSSSEPRYSKYLFEMFVTFAIRKKFDIKTTNNTHWAMKKWTKIKHWLHETINGMKKQFFIKVTQSVPFNCLIKNFIIFVFSFQLRCFDKSNEMQSDTPEATFRTFLWTELERTSKTFPLIYKIQESGVTLCIWKRVIFSDHRFYCWEFLMSFR